MKRWWVKKADVDRQPRRPGDAASSRLARTTGEAASSAGQYVRSRTISAYSPTTSTDMARLSAHDLRRHRGRLLKVLAACCGVIVVLGVFVGQLTAGIGSISYSPATISQPDAASIRSVVDDYYASRPLERLRFLLNEKVLGSYVASKIPEVKGVQAVSFDGIGSSHLSLLMRTPVASWNIGSKTLYVDDQGVSFTNNYYNVPAVAVDDQGGAVVAESSLVASGSMIRYIGQLIAALEANGSGKVTKVVLPGNMVRELDVYLEGKPYRVKVQLDRDVAAQAADVKAAVTYIDANGGAGEYVDVRVAGKAFYK